MTQVAPGWYDDGTGRLRWWDGAAWSGDVLDPAGAAPAATAPVDAVPRAAEEFPWMREAAERERTATVGTGAIATATVAAPADPIRSLQIDGAVSAGASAAADYGLERGAEHGVDPVVAWARQQAAAQQAAVQPEPPAAINEAPRRRRRVWPWIAGGAVLLVGAGAAAIAVVQLAGDPVDPSAASVVVAYNDLWAGGECASTGAVGTSAFIADLGWDDCALLADSQRTFLQSYEDYRVTVEETVVQGGVAWVDTSERYTVPGSEEERVDEYRYELVRDGDGWLIDALSAR